MKIRPMKNAPLAAILILIELANGASAWVSAEPNGNYSWYIALNGTTVGTDCEGWKVFDQWGDPLPLGVLGWIPAPEIAP